jgi:hypothetical protein
LFSELLAVTIATEETDGFRRYVYSAEKYGINHKVKFVTGSHNRYQYISQQLH